MLATSAYAILSTQRRIAADATILPNQTNIFIQTPQPPKNVIFKSTKDVAKIGPFRKPICLI
jgi:hypothetical protein